MSVYVFDLDGTICTQEEDYADALPKVDVIIRIQDLWDMGNEVIIFTARGTVTGVDWTEVTLNQLAQWDVPHSVLLFGKPAADFYIDDKAVNVKDWMEHGYTRGT